MVGAIANILKSRDVITTDDLRAFQFEVWADDDQVRKFALQSRSDYLKAMQLSGAGDSTGT